MRALIILIIYINILLSNSYSESTNCILKVEGTPKCPTHERKSVDFKIEYRKYGTSIESVRKDCGEKISVQANILCSSLTSQDYWARFYYYRDGHYTRKIPEECLNGIKKEGNLYDCNIGEIDPNNLTTSSNNKTPYIL